MGIKISKQEDEKDCGLYVLQSLIKFFHNKNIDINYLKINSTYGKEGINLLNLKEIAAKNGLRLASYGGDFEALSSLKKENLPAILILNKNGRNHYVILNKIKGNKYYISDSVEGKQLKINAEELKQEFQNVVITVEPCAYESKKKNFKIDNKVKSLISIKNYTPILILSSIINVLLSFCSTFFVKIVFDIVLPNYMKKTLIVIFAAFI